jgi:hypothetical protein
MFLSATVASKPVAATRSILSNLTLGRCFSVRLYFALHRSVVPDLRLGLGLAFVHGV